MTEKETQLLSKVLEEVNNYREQVQNDPHRLHYHLMPPVGLLNDPNGLIHFKGIYHVFYQWNPFDTTHGAKFWGHYTSTDLIHWKEERVALAPTEWYEQNGCYSGSAVESDGKLYLFYTGNVKKEDGTRETYQCLAVSEDGIVFEKHGPILHRPNKYTAHFRDPKVWKHDDRWYMVLGAQTLEEKGTVVLFSSDDLIHWEEIGQIAGSGLNGLGELGFMWECPDLIHLNGRDLLLVSPQGIEPKGHLYQNIYQSGYLSGHFDYENKSFLHGPFIELDRGFDFYAPQTFLDEKGRTILYGWMGITDEEEAHQPTEHWVHALTMPRELTCQGGKIYQRPLVELQELRRNQVVLNKVRVADELSEFADVQGIAVELLIDFLTVDGLMVISFRNEASLIYDTYNKELTLQRGRYTNSLETRTCHLNTLSKLHLFMDASSIEIFVNDGEEVFTSRYFPNHEDETITFHGTAEFNLRKWDLGK